MNDTGRGGQRRRLWDKKKGLVKICGKYFSILIFDLKGHKKPTLSLSRFFICGPLAREFSHPTTEMEKAAAKEAAEPPPLSSRIPPREQKSELSAILLATRCTPSLARPLPLRPPLFLLLPFSPSCQCWNQTNERTMNDNSDDLVVVLCAKRKNSKNTKLSLPLSFAT